MGDSGDAEGGSPFDLPPYQYTDEVTGQLKGIGVDSAGKIQEQTDFPSVGGSAGRETLNRMVARGNIDLVKWHEL